MHELVETSEEYLLFEIKSNCQRPSQRCCREGRTHQQARRNDHVAHYAGG